MRMPPLSRVTAHRRAYSLIELLAVMAIISALAGLTVGSLSPVKANALTAGGNQVADLFTAARQNSLARHAFTAVIIKTAGDARYSAFCLFELTRNDDGTFSNWKMAAPWRLLPDGIRFDPDLTVATPTLNFADSSNNPGLPVALPSVPFRGQAGQLELGGGLPNLRTRWNTDKGCSHAAPTPGRRRGFWLWDHLYRAEKWRGSGQLLRYRAPARDRPSQSRALLRPFCSGDVLIAEDLAKFATPLRTLE